MSAITEQGLRKRLAEWHGHGEFCIPRPELTELLDTIDSLRGHLDKTVGIALKLRARLNELGEPDYDDIETFGTLSQDKNGTPLRDAT